MLRIAVVALALVAAATSPLRAQERYVHAEQNSGHDLVITTSTGRRIVVPKSDTPLDDAVQVGFSEIAVSRDGGAVGWLAEYPNCCTSYPIPRVVEVFTAGTRHTFQAAIVPFYWCFVDGSARVRASSSTVHGPQHQIFEMWDVSTGAKLGTFQWLEGESHPEAPAWARADDFDKGRGVFTHHCATR